MYRFVPANGIYNYKTEVVKHYLDCPGATTTNVKWAIGGYSLHLGTSFSETEFYDEIEGYPEYAEVFSPRSEDGRSAIGYAYINNRPSIVLAAFQKATIWEVRQFMKSLGASWGVNLDGGGSSQIRYQRFEKISNEPIIDSWEPDPDPNRSVYSMIRVNPTTWNQDIGF